MTHRDTLRAWGRWLALVATGAVVFQAAGCASALGPILVSLAESLVLRAIFGPILPGL
jgi:hypothetical protein